MPQPIRRPCQVSLLGIKNLDEHAAVLGNIVALSGYLEALLGHLLAYLTGASSSVTMAMFHSVTSTDAQRAMLTAAAEQLLAGAELDNFRDLMRDFRTRYGERSRLVHNVWGTSPQHPDKAIWCAAKDATFYSARLASAQDEAQLDALLAADVDIWRQCSTYSVKDLQDVFDRLVTYTEQVRLFTVSLQNQHPLIAARIATDQARAAQASELPQESLPDQTPE